MAHGAEISAMLQAVSFSMTDTNIGGATIVIRRYNYNVPWLLSGAEDTGVQKILLTSFSPYINQVSLYILFSHLSFNDDWSLHP